MGSSFPAAYTVFLRQNGVGTVFFRADTFLPINEPATVEFTPHKGEFIFACGMDMIKGKMIVE
jgi:plastocyanin domain-containing protein